MPGFLGTMTGGDRRKRKNHVEGKEHENMARAFLLKHREQGGGLGYWRGGGG